MPYDIGVQIYTYRGFTIDEVCEELADTDVTAIELMDTHLPPDAGEDEVEATLAKLEDAGVEVRGYYGGEFDADSLDSARKRFAFASELGADYVACDFLADDDVIEEVAEMAAEHDLLVGVHNHGPEGRYQTLEDVLAVTEGAPERIGACVDTGHFFRLDETPDEVIPALGDRIHALHVSDYVDEETEAKPGDGRLDIPALLELLDEHATLTTPLTIEYEDNYDDPTPTVRQTARRLLDAQQ